MSVILIANVGNHDVMLSRTEALPEDLKPAWVPARRLGNEIIANFERYAEYIEMPLIGVCVRWLVEHEGVEPDELYVHLFASDQPQPPITPEGEWLKDSRPFAEVVRRCLLEGALTWTPPSGTPRPLRLAGKRVFIHTLPGNPADYRNMHDALSSKLGHLAQQVGGNDQLYLEITGGTPAMTSMLLLAGVDTFGERAETLYVERGSDRPYPVGVGRRLVSRQVRTALQAQLALHSYGVAHDTLGAKGAVLVPDTERRALLMALLRYADRRLAFDFERARDALTCAVQLSSGEMQSRVTYWLRELKSMDTAGLLAELIHSARIKFDQGEYADLCQRLFRFQEAGFRHLAERMGMRYKRPRDDEYVDPAWIEGVPGLSEFLSCYPVPGRDRIAIDVRRSLNRLSLSAIVEFHIERDPRWSAYRTTADHLHGLSNVADLRNKGLAGHGFKGIGIGDLDEAFDGNAQDVFDLLDQAHEGLFGRKLGPSPYEDVNAVVESFLD